jgi:small-conductance mechanosensitive channel
MKTLVLALVITLFLVGVSITSSAQQPAHAANSSTPASADTTVLLQESDNLKSDLAQLRSMLNVLASQESGTDARSSAALQTNRQMWQVIIARLAELTQRLDALEKQQHATTPAPESPKHP